MNKRLLKISLLTLIAAAIAGMTSLRADDTNSAAASNPPAKFRGSVSVVDTNAMTFTVGDQTFNVTADSQLTKNGQSATLADVVVGDAVRGSYTTDANGKLDATKVRFGKKPGAKKKSSDSGDSTPTTPPPAPSQN